MTLIRVVGMSAQCERRSARVIADHHRTRSVGLPLDPHSALDHALAHAGEATQTATAPPSSAATSVREDVPAGGQRTDLDGGSQRRLGEWAPW